MIIIRVQTLQPKTMLILVTMLKQEHMNKQNAPSIIITHIQRKKVAFHVQKVTIATELILPNSLNALRDNTVWKKLSLRIALKVPI